MYVQIIRGPVADAQGLRRLIDRWVDELSPAATGWLGSTGGVATDGRGILVARFASADDASANSERPEQGQWWAEAEKCFGDAPTFVDSDDVEEWLGGGSDEAGFVQVMSGTVTDRSRVTAMDDAFTSVAADLRPDVLGGMRVWTEGDGYTEVVWFSSEAEARAGEAKEPPAELKGMMEEFGTVMGDPEYLDLPDPWLHSPTT